MFFQWCYRGFLIVLLLFLLFPLCFLFCFSDGAPTAFLLCFGADPMADLCCSYCFLFCFPIVFLSCSYGFIAVLAWCSYGYPMLFLWRSCSKLCFSNGVPVVSLYAPFCNFPIKKWWTNLYFGVPGTLFLELFRALGAPWTPSGAKCVLKAGLGCILDAF